MKLFTIHLFLLIFLLLKTGCFSQVSDTGLVDYHYKLKPVGKNIDYHCLFKSPVSKKFIAPLCVMSAGLLLVSNDMLDRFDVRKFVRKEFRGYQLSMDNYLQYAPAVAAYLIDFAGYKSASSFFDKSMILAEAEIMMLAVVTTLKKTTHVLRPDGSDYLSFPSGHTAQAFVAASFLAHEYWKKSPWIAVTGYAVAGFTGCMRMMNNKHWASDVLFGAGIGMLCTELAYMAHFHSRTHSKTKLAFVPEAGNNTYGAGIFLSF